MANFGIEFGNRTNLGGNVGGLERQNFKEIAADSEATGSSDSSSSVTFGDFLQKIVQEANSSQILADKKIQEVAVGRSKDLHGAMLAMEKADINFRLLSQVRNKVIDAYREIMRMQV